MAPKSEQIWKEILNNQKFELLGNNNPNEGNGYNDRISWRIKFRPNRVYDDDLYHSSFFNVYLRDLGQIINPSYSRNDIFEKGLRIENCSDNYRNTFLKYFTSDRYYHRNGIFRELGQWGEHLSSHGRVIMEIISWFDNKSSQFYGFELQLLDNDYCKIKGNNVIYNAPFELENNKEVFKKVNIPKTKCIIINFPNELGGYIGFKSKVKEIIKLGSQHLTSLNPGEYVKHMMNWDKQFHKIVSDWGVYSKQEDNNTEFYKVLSRFKFIYMVVLCVHELISGLQQLISFLNINLEEKAMVVFDIQQYNISYFKDMQQKWMEGELTFNEAYEFLRL